MSEIEGQRFQLVEGETIRDSLLKMLGFVLLGVFVLAPLGGGMVYAWWNNLTLGDRGISWYGALFGAVMLLIGILMPLVFLLTILNRRRLIFGKSCLQLVTGSEKVTEQFPYVNIAKAELFRNHESKDFITDFIGIELRDAHNPDTLCPASDKSMDLHGWHYRLTDESWNLPLEQIYEKMKKRMVPNA